MKKLYLIIFSLIINFSHSQYEGFSDSGWEKQLEIEKSFQGLIDNTSFKKHLMKLTERPHVVGSQGNEEVIKYIGKVMEGAGLEITNYPYDVYLPNKPGSSLVEIVTPSRQVLNQKEDIIDDDPFTQNPELWKGWNAFSGSGDITAEIVYANYGLKEDLRP